jgi:hypothetical protein
MEKNRRKSERVNVSLEVMIESVSGKREVRISDLSLTGCFVDSISIVNNHEQVKLNARDPKGEWIELKGEVVSIFPGIGFGVQFAQIPEVELNKLKQLIIANGGNLTLTDDANTQKQPSSVEAARELQENSTKPESVRSNEFNKFLEELNDLIDSESKV